MENSRRHKTKQEFAQELGMSRSTLYRRMHRLNWKSTGELLSPAEQKDLKKALDNYKKLKTVLREEKAFRPH
ncbi:MAG: HTH domain-containing protein [Haliscomenobacteraceae bacterium CHB4]|nr:hypothetical protein [Saprospiraceae bacterium]MCE7925282.1 HTH domain-containing protein [Haliscomenobacteraceae bacterium CHB4]